MAYFLLYNKIQTHTMKLTLSTVITLLILCFSVNFVFAGFPLKVVTTGSSQQHVGTYAHKNNFAEKVFNFANRVKQRFAPDRGSGLSYGSQSLIFGLLSVFVFPPLSILAIIYGARGMKAGGRSKGAATAGFILGIIGAFYLLVALVLVGFFLFAYGL